MLFWNLILNMAHWRGVQLQKHHLDKKINKTLNRSIRNILFKQKYVKQLYKYLGILPLKQNIKFQQGKFM